MASVRGAGVQSGQGGVFLDSGKPFSGVIQDTLRQDPHRSKTPALFCSTGDARHCDVLGQAPRPCHQVGAIPRPGGRFQQVAIPGYSGYVAGKVAENVHGQTFGAENERATQMLPLRQMRRTISAPESIVAPPLASGTRGHAVAPRVPGYAGTIPGKHSETVHAMRFAEASEHAKSLRENNPHVSCHGWLKQGQWPGDRLATYKWNNRFQRLDSHELFTPEQEQQAYASNRRLGQTFGLKPPPPKPHRPGDRFLHSLYKKANEEARLDPASQPPAGQPSQSAMLDQQRWMNHFSLTLKAGNQRTYN